LAAFTYTGQKEKQIVWLKNADYKLLTSKSSVLLHCESNNFLGQIHGITVMVKRTLLIPSASLQTKIPRKTKKKEP
jgi:hypothetical protein